ncbi:MAG: 16S rRNA (cytosine(1402)-N(4))-methyltransferase RsmH [Planctomycetota bacterium]|nr:16S rRNA (cytosine(1402)-N(4))-methyltransferase RsmH [Planctomycetota bacterium]
MDVEAAGEGVGPLHIPVLPTQVVAAFGDLSARPGAGWIVDGTLGLGGHAELLLEAHPWANVFGVDHDPDALVEARTRLERFGDRVRIARGRFSDLALLLREHSIGMPVGMLFDIGVSSLQLDRRERGFSFQHDGPLDMRMDPTRDRTAAEIVNTWDESDLSDLFFHEGGETRARRIARAVVEARVRAPFQRTAPLADLVIRALGGGSGGRLHPATRVFQALRRAVNEEGEELLAALHTADHALADGGRLAVISFHSGEDGEVKRFLQSAARDGRFSILTKRPLEAEHAEARANPRARSAKLRVAERRRTEITAGPRVEIDSEEIE